jgi:FkbM family methyltransferase
MTEIGRGSLETLQTLFNKGVRYSACIDVGCADGQFFLIGHSSGFFKSTTPIHIDPNPIYEPSLRTIKEVLGGEYSLCAASNADGEMEMIFSENPWWSSARSEDDLYWKRIGSNAGQKTKVPAITLDSLQDRFNLRPPYFLRLDVQGSELLALKGAKTLLKQTHVILCECDIDDFASISTFLDRNNFHLYDIPTLNYVGGDTLGWFYAVFVSDAISHVLPKGFWKEEQTESIIELQKQQRQKILELNKNYLAHLKENLIPKSAACPCGSGKKYKRCCGA